MIIPDINLLLYTYDADFVRFDGLRWFNPVTGARSSRPPRSKTL